jgi:hypothetical protein
MGPDVSWNADPDRVQETVLAFRNGRVTAARRGARRCLSCGERRALFFFRGVVKADRDHNLCFECYRATVNRLRARRLADVETGAMFAQPRLLPSKQVTDRAALLACLALRRRRAQIAARHALDAPEPVLASAALAS